MRKYKGIGISRIKEFYLGLILSLTLLVVLFAISFTATYVIHKEETTAKTDIVVDNIKKQITNTFETIDHVSKDIFLSEDFQRETDLLYDATNNLEATKNIGLIFENNVRRFESSFIKDICYIPRDTNGQLDTDNHVYYGFNATLFSDINEKNFRTIIEKASLEENKKGNLFVTELYNVGNETNLICFIRNISSIKNDDYGKKMGIGIIVINESILIELLDYSYIVNGLVTSINSGSNISYYSSNYQDMELDSDSVIKNSSSLLFYDWTITTYFDSNSFFDSIKVNFISLIITMIILIVLYTITYFAFHRKNLSSLYYLFNNFSQISKDNSLRKMQYINDTEINRVIEAYNEMVESISTLNENIILEKDRAIQSEIQSKDFEIKSLYAQINKHFIINVLSIIHSLINLKQIENANYCLENLSDFLRYSLTMESDSYFKDELFNIKSYFNIQTIRYPKVKYSIEFDPILDEVKVPKLIIQPLVENAYVHGLKKKVGSIDVSCRMKDNIIYISVVDDGGATTKEELDKLNEKIKLCRESDTDFEKLHGIALINIQKRLNLMYGNNKARLKLRITDDNKTESLIVIELE